MPLANWQRYGLGDTDWRAFIENFLQLRNANELLQGARVIDFEQLIVLQGGNVFYGNVDTIDRAEDAAALLFQGGSKMFDFLDGDAE